jgi:hypothetical protein
MSWGREWRRFEPKFERLAGIGDGFGFSITGGSTAGQFGKDGGSPPGFLVMLDQQPQFEIQLH